MSRPVPAAPRPSTPRSDDTKSPSLCTTILRPEEQIPDPIGVTVTQPVERGAKASGVLRAEAAAPNRFVPEETVDIIVPETNANLHREQPILYVAIGGVGIQVLCRLRADRTVRRIGRGKRSN